jgi:hypothetical protein
VPELHTVDSHVFRASQLRFCSQGTCVKLKWCCLVFACLHNSSIDLILRYEYRLPSQVVIHYSVEWLPATAHTPQLRLTSRHRDWKESQELSLFRFADFGGLWQPSCDGRLARTEASYDTRVAAHDAMLNATRVMQQYTIPIVYLDCLSMRYGEHAQELLLH